MSTYHHYDSKGNYAGKSTTDSPGEMPSCGCIIAMLWAAFLAVAIGSTFGFWHVFWWVIAGLTVVGIIVTWIVCFISDHKNDR